MGRGGEESTPVLSEEPEGQVKEEEKEEEERLATPESIRRGLSQLGPTADGFRQAYLKLTLQSEQNLTSLRGIEKMVHIQTVVVAGNQLRDLAPLSALPNLTSIDASRNRLTDVLDIPCPPPNLRYVNLSDNEIKVVGDLSKLKFVQELVLDRNAIESFASDTFAPLHNLKRMSLASNRLTTLDGLHEIASLKSLNVRDNRIEMLPRTFNHPRLTFLDMSHNSILELAGLEQIPMIVTLLVAFNDIPSLDCLYPLSKLSVLRKLSIQGNPLVLAANARLHTLHILPSLSELDVETVIAEEKVHAANLHGADVESLRNIRAKFFPRGEKHSLYIPDEHSLVRGSDDGTSLLVARDSPAKRISAVKPTSMVSTSHDIDDMSARVPMGMFTENISQLATYFVNKTKNQAELARACFNWIRHNVRVPPLEEYHISGSIDPPASFLIDDLAPVRSELCSSLRGSWTDMVAQLFAELCQAAGLEAHVVVGYARFPNTAPGLVLKEPNHCWNAVRIRDQLHSSLTATSTSSPMPPPSLP